MKNIKLAIKAGCLTATLAVSAVTGYAYTAPSTYVSLDVNPSIEYSVNAFDRVIKIIAVNEDGERIVNELDLKNEKIEKAIEITIDKLKEEGYITDDDYSGIVIAVSNKNKEKADELSKELENKLENNMEKYEEKETETSGNLDTEKKEETDLDEGLEGKNDIDDVDKEDEENNLENEIEEEKDAEDEKSKIEIIVEAVGRDRVEEARKLGITPGKLNLVQKLMASSDEYADINEEELKELLQLSVKEINKLIKVNRKHLKFEKTLDFENDINYDLDDDDYECFDVDDNYDLDEKDNKKHNKIENKKGENNKQKASKNKIKEYKAKNNGKSKGNNK